MASTYAQRLGGSPNSAIGSQIAMGTLPAEQLNRFQALTGLPASARNIMAVGQILDDTEKVINDAVDSSSDSSEDTKTSSDNKLISPPGGESKILTTNEGLDKANQMIDNATKSQSDGTPQGDNAADSDAEFIRKTVNGMLNSDNPQNSMEDAKKTPFYKDSNFYTTLLMMVVAAASGMRPMQTMQMAMAFRQKAKTRDFLQNNMKELEGRYDPVSIEMALESSDLSKLKQKSLSPVQTMELQAMLQQRQQQRLWAHEDQEKKATQGQAFQKAAQAENNTPIGAVLNGIAQNESNNGLTSKNIYQMHKDALKDAGYNGSVEQFSKEGPEVQRTVAKTYLEQKLAENGGDMSKAIMAFNVGTGTIKGAEKAQEANGGALEDYLPGGSKYSQNKAYDATDKEHPVAYENRVMQYVKDNYTPKGGAKGSQDKGGVYAGSTGMVNGVPITATGVSNGQSGKQERLQAKDAKGNTMWVSPNAFDTVGADTGNLSDKQVSSISTLSNTPGITAYFNKLGTRIAGIQSVQSSIDAVNQIMNSNMSPEEKRKAMAGLPSEVQNQLAAIRNGGLASVTNAQGQEIQEVQGLGQKWAQEVQNSIDGMPTKATLQAMNNQFNQMKKSDEGAFNDLIQYQKQQLGKMQGIDPRVINDAKLKLDMKNVAYNAAVNGEITPEEAQKVNDDDSVPTTPPATKAPALTQDMQRQQATTWDEAQKLGAKAKVPASAKQNGVITNKKTGQQYMVINGFAYPM